MKRLLIVIAVAMLLPLIASAQTTTASGTLAVSATVQGSIAMTFANSASGVALSSGAGTNTASLNFGTVSAYGTIPSTITRSVAANNFTVSTPVGIEVVEANITSANYNLAAQLNAPDANNTWAVAGNTINATGPTTVGQNVAYANAVDRTIALAIPLTGASGTISNTINFTASAN